MYLLKEKTETREQIFMKYGITTSMYEFIAIILILKSNSREKELELFNINRNENDVKIIPLYERLCNIWQVLNS
jgi:hypothetical protein